MTVQEWASGKRKPVPGTKPRRRRFKIRSRRKGVFAAIWLLITSLFLISWITIGGVLWMVATLFAGLATVMLVIATFDPNADPLPAPQRRKPVAAKPRGNGPTVSARAQPGSSPKPRKRVCSARCRASTKPITTCNCSCGGKTHGAKHRDA